jgi:hypothetical protein
MLGAPSVEPRGEQPYVAIPSSVSMGELPRP